MNIINLSNKNFIKVLLNTALPITVQHFIGYALNAMDTIMVGQLGEIKIASVGIANQVFLILLLFLCGISNSGAVFIAQFHGKNEAIGIKKYLALMLFINIVITLLFIIFVITAPHLIMGIFSQDYQVISSGVEYLKTVAFSYLFTSISVIYISTLRSSNEVKVTIFTSFISLLLDTLLSY
jgi:Na+-driven multidrug efflux pump